MLSDACFEFLCATDDSPSRSEVATAVRRLNEDIERYSDKVFQYDAEVLAKLRRVTTLYQSGKLEVGEIRTACEVTQEFYDVPLPPEIAVLFAKLDACAARATAEGVNVE